VVSTESNGEGYLVLSDAYDDGWLARIDGAPALVYRADYVLRALSLPAGSHRVEFTYRPRGFEIGLWLTLGSAAVLALWALARVGDLAAQVRRLSERLRRRRAPSVDTRGNAPERR
jgi:uncharacterized membrane protein YfhO